jgi:hypothetical protein
LLRNLVDGSFEVFCSDEIGRGKEERKKAKEKKHVNTLAHVK